MIAVRMVKVSVHDVIDVIAMRNCFMSTAGAVDVIGVVSCAGMSGSTTTGIVVAHLDRVFFDLAVLADVMEVAVVQVVNVIAMLNSRMFAVGSMVVVVIVVQVRHFNAP